MISYKYKSIVKKVVEKMGWRECVSFNTCKLYFGFMISNLHCENNIIFNYWWFFSNFVIQFKNKDECMVYWNR